LQLGYLTRNSQQLWVVRLQRSVPAPQMHCSKNVKVFAMPDVGLPVARLASLNLSLDLTSWIQAILLGSPAQSK
jgi:hypothetical protein